MDISAILLVVSYAYLLSALVRFFIARSAPSIEDERKKRLDDLYGRQGKGNEGYCKIYG